MKFFFIILTVLILFSGCSHKNAFTEFKMSKEQQLSISSLKSSKITSKNGEINGVFSAVYLNEVYPKIFNNNENFFVIIFIKESHDTNKSANGEISLKLNSKAPTKIEELPEDNKFSHLVPIKSDWNRYYLVSFSKDDKVNLAFENDQSFSAVLMYQKGEE